MKRVLLAIGFFVALVLLFAALAGAALRQVSEERATGFAIVASPLAIVLFLAFVIALGAFSSWLAKVLLRSRN